MAIPAISGRDDWRGIFAALVYTGLATVGIFAGGADAALTIGLAAVLLIAGLRARAFPRVDPALASLAALFILLIWASVLWSIVPDRSVRGAVQMTGLLVAALVLLGERDMLARRAEIIFAVALVAAIVGPGLAFLDFVTGHPIMRHVVAHPELTGSLDTKFDRGLSYQCILVWPIAAHGWTAGRRRLALAALLALVAALAVSRADTGRLALAVGLLTVAVSTLAPRLVVGVLAAVVACALATPALVAAFGQRLIPLAGGIKPSLAHRLEIWDYMAARVRDRPLVGWGWWSADALPIRPDELARYHYVSAAGTPHPHNNWLQLWVESGAGGALIGAIFALILVNRALRLDARRRPFALACVAAALVMSLASYDLATDSWWCILAATGLLWRLPPAPAR